MYASVRKRRVITKSRGIKKKVSLQIKREKERTREREDKSARSTFRIRNTVLKVLELAIQNGAIYK